VSEQVQLLLLQLLATILLTATTTATTTIASYNVYGQAGGDTSAPSESNQEPTEEKQGGEYSGFEETGNQTDGTSNEEANPTPQAPIRGFDVQQQNKTTTTTTESATADERREGPFGTTMLVGMGAVAAVAIAVGAWYYRKKKMLHSSACGLGSCWPVAILERGGYLFSDQPKKAFPVWARIYEHDVGKAEPNEFFQLFYRLIGA
jgi:hypothetical protein